MRGLAPFAVAAGLGAAALVMSSSPASAAIVCNASGVCWHVAQPYPYNPGWGLVVHPDNWRWGPHQHYVWREHAGRGYWRGREWVKF